MNKCSCYIIDLLYELGVREAYGVPGGVILPFLYALASSKKIKPHLSYHEQQACYSAMGYAQANNTVGLAFCTKGPGVTNMVTAIADAYFDSVPVIVVTAHTTYKKMGTRCDLDQELNTKQLFTNICKAVFIIDTVTNINEVLYKAIQTSVNGRKGPVVLDVETSLFDVLIPNEFQNFNDNEYTNCIDIIDLIYSQIEASSRPLILLGDGIKQSNMTNRTRQLIEKLALPVVSSRYSIDVYKGKYYFGYIGSHGIRYANYLLEKSDLIISLGNRLSFPVDSASYSFMKEKKIIRMDIDSSEFYRQCGKAINLCCDLNKLVSEFVKISKKINKKNNWMEYCFHVKKVLFNFDLNEATDAVEKILNRIPLNSKIVCDVGNNEFWVSRAYVRGKNTYPIYFSKSFGVLGNSLPKSIGVSSTCDFTVCFTGDQGFQFNLSSLEAIGHEKLPILIFIFNNKSSGMIKSREYSKYGNNFIHVNYESGYANPEFSQIAKAYSIRYMSYEEYIGSYDSKCLLPMIVEIEIDEGIGLEPSLKRNDSMINMIPYLPYEIKKGLDKYEENKLL